LDITGHFLQPFRRNLAQEILQDHKTRRQHMGLAAVRKGTPGPEMREYGLGGGQKSRARTKITGNWSWLTPAALGTIRDLQSAGTLIQLPGLYRAYERERSVKIFALFSHRSASQATLHRNAVPEFCKSRRIRADSTEEYSARTGKPGIRAWLQPGRASQDGKCGNTGLTRGWRGIPGPEQRESGPGKEQNRRAKTKIIGNWSRRPGRGARI
jgi:hypothetical protein